MPYADPAAQAAYQREWIARRRSEWFADKRCTLCGSTEDLEIDHIDRATKVSHRIWSWAAERRDAELEKCQVLCHPCHIIKTDLAGDNPTKANGFRHGTPAMYEHHGCRCDACRAQNAARKRRWRASRQQSNGEAPQALR